LLGVRFLDQGIKGALVAGRRCVGAKGEEITRGDRAREVTEAVEQPKFITIKARPLNTALELAAVVLKVGECG
jgi:hypothetical protein